MRQRTIPTEGKLEAEYLLLAKLDESLLSHAKSLYAMPDPQIEDVYFLRGLAGTHYYLKNVHQFDPLEVETLLRFADPLAVANHCREGNVHEYSFPICELLQETRAWDLFELTRPVQQKPLSLLKQIDALNKAIKDIAAPGERTKSVEAR